MHWLITGGCGFIGRNLSKKLLVADESDRVRIVDDFSVASVDDLEGALLDRGRLEVIRGDVRDEALALRATAGVDVVVHLAANTGIALSISAPREDCSVNVLGTLNYLEASRRNGARRFVFASSGATLGEAKPPIHEQLPARPISPYGASKLAGEAYCSAYYGTFGIDTVALRFGNCYGPGSDHKSSIVAKFIREALAGRRWEIFGDGNQTRDFVYIDDIVEAIRRAGTFSGVGGEIFQIATNSETSVLALASLLSNVLSRKGINVQPPAHLPGRRGEVQSNYSDTSKARTRLGWEATTDLTDGLRKTVEWFTTRERRFS